MVDPGLTRHDVMVFGAAGALGAGVAAAFADMGAAVVGADRVKPAVERRLAGVSYETLDVLDDAAVSALLSARSAPWAVINTIGGFAPRRPLAELDVVELNAQLQLNLVSAAIITKNALRVMLPAGSGRILHTASHAGVDSTGAGFPYAVSKLGVLRLVEMAASEVRGTGITVNCVVPHIIDTPANRAAMPAADHESWPKVHEIARSYVYLASPDSSLVNGAAIPV
ncbi:MAG TPA: SDR family oxidoreductase [Streptosporangiaceae bacterium]|nr:SDR family oxidoreductase [Streptosporangiaceae bacterium]